MSPLTLPQTIELERDDAWYFYGALAVVYRDACQAPLQAVPLDAGLLVALPLLKRLGKRLYNISQTERRQVGKPRRKPRAFRLSCEEVVVVMRYVLPEALPGALPVLGKVQQKSLNLTAYVNF